MAPLWNMICQKDSGFGRHWRLTYLVIINESGHIHKHSPNGDVLMDFCHMESESHQLCGVLKVVHPRVFPGSCSDKMAGFVGILRTASASVWRCFLWSEGVTMQWWKWYLCRKQSFDDGSVSPLPKRRRVGKSCQTTGMPLSHVNEADSSGPEAHQPARPKGRASDVFWRSSEHVVRSLFFGSAEESLLQCPQGTWRLFALLLSRCQSAFHRELPPVTWCKMRKQEHCGKAICWICDRIIGPII